MARSTLRSTIGRQRLALQTRRSPGAKSFAAAADAESNTADASRAAATCRVRRDPWIEERFNRLDIGTNTGVPKVRGLRSGAAFRGPARGGAAPQARLRLSFSGSTP